MTNFSSLLIFVLSSLTFSSACPCFHLNSSICAIVICKATFSNGVIISKYGTNLMIMAKLKWHSTCICWYWQMLLPSHRGSCCYSYSNLTFVLASLFDEPWTLSNSSSYILLESIFIFVKCYIAKECLHSRCCWQMKTTVDRAKLDSKAVAIIKRSGGRNSQVGQQGGSIRGNKHISFKTLNF